MFRHSDIIGEYGQRPLYRMLGYFSVIGLLRVHVLLGDFTLALKVMENVELNQKVRDRARKAGFTPHVHSPFSRRSLV